MLLSLNNLRISLSHMCHIRVLQDGGRPPKGKWVIAWGQCQGGVPSVHIMSLRHAEEAPQKLSMEAAKCTQNTTSVQVHVPLQFLIWLGWLNQHWKYICQGLSSGILNATIGTKIHSHYWQRYVYYYRPFEEVSPPNFFFFEDCLGWKQCTTQEPCTSFNIIIKKRVVDLNQRPEVATSI